MILIDFPVRPLTFVGICSEQFGFSVGTCTVLKRRMLSILLSVNPTQFFQFQMHEKMDNVTNFSQTPGFILCNWCSLVILALFMTWLFDPLGQIPPKLSRDPMNSYAQNYLIQHEASWEKKLKKLCCYWGGGGEHKENINAGFKEAAREFCFTCFASVRSTLLN